VTRPKEDGGLGILDLKTQNDALLLKYLHKFFNRLIFHGYTLSGRNTIPMANCPVTLKEAHFGGKVS
jgi:hypothetical protein